MFADLKRKRSELYNITPGTLLTSIVEAFGEPDIIESSESNYRNIIYKLNDNEYYRFTIEPNGIISTMFVITNNSKKIIFYDFEEEKNNIDEESTSKNVFSIKLGINISKVYEQFGKPDGIKDLQTVYYKYPDDVIINVFFSSNGKIWKVQYLKNNKEIVSRFDIRILDNEK